MYESCLKNYQNCRQFVVEKSIQKYDREGKWHLKKKNDTGLTPHCWYGNNSTEAYSQSIDSFKGQ